MKMLICIEEGRSFRPVIDLPEDKLLAAQERMKEKSAGRYTLEPHELGDAWPMEYAPFSKSLAFALQAAFGGVVS